MVNNHLLHPGMIQVRTPGFIHFSEPGNSAFTCPFRDGEFHPSAPWGFRWGADIGRSGGEEAETQCWIGPKPQGFYQKLVPNLRVFTKKWSQTWGILSKNRQKVEGYSSWCLVRGELRSWGYQKSLHNTTIGSDLELLPGFESKHILVFGPWFTVKIFT